MREVEEILEHWREEPPVGKMLREYFRVEVVVSAEPESVPEIAPREVTEEEYQRICARERAFAAKYGAPRSPFG